MTTQTYTLAYLPTMLLATIPDGGDLESALESVSDHTGAEIDRAKILTQSGLVLTDEIPEDETRIVWDAQWGIGFLFGDDGMDYRYAVRPASAPRFAVDGHPAVTLAEFLATNADDEDVCEWARSAKPGDFFPGVVPCDCVAA